MTYEQWAVWYCGTDGSSLSRLEEMASRSAWKKATDAAVAAERERCAAVVRAFNPSPFPGSENNRLATYILTGGPPQIEPRPVRTCGKCGRELQFNGIPGLPPGSWWRPWWSCPDCETPRPPTPEEAASAGMAFTVVRGDA